jgi:hypothetical protein
MATTYTYKIVNLERETVDDYVFTIHYTIIASDGTHEAGSFGSIGLKRPDTLIPYADLTEEKLIEWLKGELNSGKKTDEDGNEVVIDRVAELEANLQAQLDEKAAPTTAKGLPW